MELRGRVLGDDGLEGDVHLAGIHHLLPAQPGVVHVDELHAQPGEALLGAGDDLVDAHVERVGVQQVEDEDAIAAARRKRAQFGEHVRLVADDLARMLEHHLAGCREAQRTGVVEEPASQVVGEGVHVPAQRGLRHVQVAGGRHEALVGGERHEFSVHLDVHERPTVLASTRFMQNVKSRIPEDEWACIRAWEGLLQHTYLGHAGAASYNGGGRQGLSAPHPVSGRWGRLAPTPLPSRQTADSFER